MISKEMRWEKGCSLRGQAVFSPLVFFFFYQYIAIVAPSMYLKQSYYYIQIIIMKIFYFVDARLRCGFVSFST